MPATKPSQISLLRIVKSVLQTIGIEFWIVSMGTFYIGWAVASKKVFPDGLSILGLAIIGPLMGGFTFLYNTFSDMAVDKLSERKSHAIFLTKIIGPTKIFLLSIVFCLVGLVLSLVISHILLLLMLVITFLSVLYSHPSTRFKSRGGLDLLINMVGLGVICPIAGWSLVRPIFEFPIFYLLSIFLIIGGLYAPTTVADYKADKLGGLNTLAVRFGPRNTMYMGFQLMATGVIGLFIEGYFNYVIPKDVLNRLWPTLVIQLVFYMWLMRQRMYKRILLALVLIVIAQTLGTILFLFHYSNTWAL